jgi:hypothetical protein
MIRCKVRSVLYLAGTFLLSSSTLWAAESVVSKTPDSSGTFCYLRFPAIREETLAWDRPVLKDPSEGDVISFYGPCSHDPLGKEEVYRQRVHYQQQLRRLPAGN